MTRTTEPLLTIIIPYYNKGYYINETIDSLINQTNDNYKLLIVDDGSTLEHSEIIKEICDKHNNFNYIYKDNGGVSSARNLGILNSNTRYISFLDADDLLDKNYVQIMVDDIMMKEADI